MAKIGVDNLFYGIITEENEDGITYGGAKNFGEPIDVTVTVENENATMHAGGKLVESSNEVKGGTIKLGIDEGSDELFADILGHEINEVGELIRHVHDAAPYCGIARILEKVYRGERIYKVELVAKAKFKEPSQEEKTQGESMEFVGYTIEGALIKPVCGVWSKSKDFKTKKEAREYLLSLFSDKSKKLKK